jgi:hypothetical protein
VVNPGEPLDWGEDPGQDSPFTTEWITLGKIIKKTIERSTLALLQLMQIGFHYVNVS